MRHLHRQRRPRRAFKRRSAHRSEPPRNLLWSLPQAPAISILPAQHHRRRRYRRQRQAWALLPSTLQPPRNPDGSRPCYGCLLRRPPQELPHGISCGSARELSSRQPVFLRPSTPLHLNLSVRRHPRPKPPHYLQNRRASFPLVCGRGSNFSSRRDA